MKKETLEGSIASPNDDEAFLSCPIASHLINTREDALAYYAIKLVGNEHRVTLRGGAVLVVRFNPEEIHLFTDKRSPCPADCVVHRPAPRGRQVQQEVRCFMVERARKLDRILLVIENPSRAVRARIPGGTQLFGPADATGDRLSVVVGLGDRGGCFVRTAYPVNKTEYSNVLKTEKSSPWPPK